MPSLPLPRAVALTLSLALGAIFTVGCGGGKNPDLEAKDQTVPEQVIGQNKYQVLSGKETLVQEGTSLKGVGKVIFADALEKPQVAKNFAIDTQLEVGGKLVFTAFANNDLARGVTFTLERKEEGKPLTGAITTGEDESDVSEYLAAFDPTKRVKLLVDLHNDHDPFTHFLIWDGNKPVGEKPKETALVDFVIDGVGFGVRTGLELNKAQIFDVKTSGALHVH